ncbi:tetratricopeptide repeat protein [uncultured Phenylobacterium sp.]|uniref:CHAT domain-containing protein n=1 Tax=uncultured Phenylobacterium sp. TaxID=349273 RepID=UPI0025D210E4|nr:tetratricopeptide repeat protein [uncultured Phenylobacterium sp.]
MSGEPGPITRGRALFGQGRFGAALAAFDEAIAVHPRSPLAHSGRARALVALGRAGEGLASADRALGLDPGLADAWRGRGLALLELKRPDEALAAFRAVAPAGTPVEQADSVADVGLALAGLGRHDEASATYDEALAIAPHAPLARYRRAWVRLLRRDFAGGWDDYEARWLQRHATAGHMTPAFRERLTLGPAVDDLRGQRVLVVAEQGVGDVIMFASVLPDLAAIAAKVTCVVEFRLLTLFSVSFPDIEVVAGSGPALVDLARIDRVVAIGSLPAAFRRAEADFPGRPYLRPMPRTVEAWRARLGPSPGLRRIGISWRGGAAQTGVAARSMPLETLRPLFEHPGYEVVSLQYGDVTAELAAVNAGLARPIVSFPRKEIDDFEALAGLVCALDGVVTVQTALAHLTGAIGQLGLVMIPPRPEWRYGDGGTDMPWYASLRLFRQADGEGWAPVLGRVIEALPPS